MKVSNLPPRGDDEGNQFPFLLGEDFVEKHNIAWRVEIAREDASNPILEPKYPWESSCVFGHGTVLLDPIDGIWKAWYIALPEPQPFVAPGAGRRLCYAESADGLNWTRPELDISPYPGYPKTNILISIESGGPCQHASVIIHPDAPEDQRYEMFMMRLPGWECPYDIVEGFPVPEGHSSHRGAGFTVGMFRYVSSDGKRWRPWEQIHIETADSGWVSQVPDGSYVMYHKIGIPALPGGMVPYDVAAGVCRIMVRRTSKDGGEWSLPEIVLSPDWQDSQDTQFMELTRLPEKGGYVGLVSVYHVLNQTVDLQFAGSRDGKTWWRPDRRACLPLRPLGDIGGGQVWPMHPLVEHDGRIYVYYSGSEGAHADYMSTEPVENMKAAGFKNWPHFHEPLTLGNDVYSPLRGIHWNYSSLCRASWEKGRLWAAVTASGGNLPGDLLTREVEAQDKEIVINLVTIKDGSLEAELLADGKVLPGFARGDCLPLSGNLHMASLKWKGGIRCPAGRVQIRFFLRRVCFYGFELRNVVSDDAK